MKANFVDKYPYAVVQFLRQLPRADIDDYVCIPRSWIRVRRATDTKSIVAYPDEPSSITKMRIMNCEEPLDEWKLYMAIVKVEAPYNNNYKKFNEVDRSNLCNLVISSELENSHDYRINQDRFITVADEIVKLFPTEIRQLYYIPRTVGIDGTAVRGSGALYEKYNIEKDSYNDANEYIMKKYHTTLRTKSLAVIRTDYKRVPATSTKRYSPSLKTINLLNPQSKKNRHQLKVVDRVTQSDTISKPSEYPEHSNVESRTLTSSNLAGAVSFENTVIKENYKKDHQDQASQPSSDDILLRYPYIQREPEKDKEKGIQDHRISNLRTCTLDLPEPLIQDLNIGLNTSFVIQNLTERNNQCSQLKIPKSSPVIQEHPQVLLKQKTPDHSSEVECATTKPAAHSEMTSASDASIVCTNSAEHQDSNSHQQAKQSVISVLNQADVWADQFYDIFQKMKINFSETCQIAYDVHKSFVQTQKVIECIANASENLRALKKGKVVGVTSKEVTMEVQQIAEVNQAERKEEESLDVSMEVDEKENNDVDSKSSKKDDNCGSPQDNKDVKGQDRDNEVSKTTRGHIRTFVLPPEYDPNDTKWTLKYRENDPKLNLVELVPGSNVFINSIKLAHCVRSARDCKALARKLLEEIFTQSALSVCSLTGVRANAFDISGTNVRPGLDANARMAILTFVEKHALQEKWGMFDSQSVINTLRSKIQDIRAKHAKKA